MIGIVWDYVWELSDLLYSIKLFPICQPLSPTRREANKSILVKPYRELSVSIAEGLTPKSLAGKIAPASISKPIIL